MTGIERYLSALEVALKSGSATEHTYRRALETLLADANSSLTVINEPKHQTCGAPDIIVLRKNVPLGYIETKDIGENLDKVIKTEQLKRYLKGLNNLILTDYLQFRWYVGGEQRLTVQLGTVSGSRIKTSAKGKEELELLFQNFFTAETISITNPKDFAVRLADSARMLREVLTNAFKRENEDGTLKSQLQSFKQVLMNDISEKEFIDMYTQTIAYGLFSARLNVQAAEFKRETAAFNLPKTNPFLRKLFASISGPELDDEPYAWAVLDMVELLRKTDTRKVFSGFGVSTKQTDPVIHFYETFLREYDPKTKEIRGVFYTPEPIVSYIVRSLDSILKCDFMLHEGLADTTKVMSKVTYSKPKVELHKTLIVDPACGTGTFLHHVIRLIKDRFIGNEGMWTSYVSQHLIPRLFGFELLMASYAVAHLKLSLYLADSGYNFHGSERLNVFLTNSLEEPHPYSGTLFAHWLAVEANEASRVKKDLPIMVILGNPPYSGISQNKSKDKSGEKTFIGKLIHDYHFVDGKPLGERKNWLQNDYVKFIRFSEWRISQTGEGVIGLITDNSYIDGPTFRGMRNHLMKTFNQIYILNLHGNSNKKEKAPDGSPDKNVFDIQQGVSIVFFIKRKGKNGTCKVYYNDLWGSRDYKYEVLEKTEIKSTKWIELKPTSPKYLFSPANNDYFDEYEEGYQLDKAMNIHQSGITTARDGLVVGFDDNEIIQRFNTFLSPSLSDVEVKERMQLSENYAWTVSEARAKMKEVGKIDDLMKDFLYRPYNMRRVLYHPAVVWRPRAEVMKHLLNKDNIALVTTRQTHDKWDVFATDTICGHKCCAGFDVNYVFPLMIIDDEQALALQSGKKSPNFSRDFLSEVCRKLGVKQVASSGLPQGISARDIFDYMYALFCSEGYRERYSEFLKADFPRIQIPSNIELFRALASLGHDIIELQTLRATHKIEIGFRIQGSNKIEKVSFIDNKIYINETQYFENVSEDVWLHVLGGFQVCKKWLTDRQGRTLTYEDLIYYEKVIASILETKKKVREIDSIISKNGGFPLR